MQPIAHSPQTLLSGPALKCLTTFQAQQFSSYLSSVFDELNHTLCPPHLNPLGHAKVQTYYRNLLEPHVIEKRRLIFQGVELLGKVTRAQAAEDYSGLKELFENEIADYGKSLVALGNGVARSFEQIVSGIGTQPMQIGHGTQLLTENDVQDQKRALEQFFYSVDLVTGIQAREDCSTPNHQTQELTRLTLFANEINNEGEFIPAKAENSCCIDAPSWIVRGTLLHTAICLREILIRRGLEITQDFVASDYLADPNTTEHAATNQERRKFWENQRKLSMVVAENGTIMMRAACHTILGDSKDLTSSLQALLAPWKELAEKHGAKFSQVANLSSGVMSFGADITFPVTITAAPNTIREDWIQRSEFAKLSQTVAFDCVTKEGPRCGDKYQVEVPYGALGSAVARANLNELLGYCEALLPMQAGASATVRIYIGKDDFKTFMEQRGAQVCFIDVARGQVSTRSYKESHYLRLLTAPAAWEQTARMPEGYASENLILPVGEVKDIEPAELRILQPTLTNPQAFAALRRIYSKADIRTIDIAGADYLPDRHTKFLAKLLEYTADILDEKAAGHPSSEVALDVRQCQDEGLVVPELIHLQITANGEELFSQTVSWQILEPEPAALFA